MIAGIGNSVNGYTIRPVMVRRATSACYGGPTASLTSSWRTSERAGLRQARRAGPYRDRGDVPDAADRVLSAALAGPGAEHRHAAAAEDPDPRAGRQFTGPGSSTAER